MDTTGCMGASCAGLKTVPIETAKQCSVPIRVNEDIEGCECRPKLIMVKSANNLAGLGKLPGDGYEMPMV
jgi:hypothetical protein